MKPGRIAILTGIATGLVLLDQISKIYITSHFSVGISVPLIPSFLSISLAHNTGMAFGLLQDSRLLLTLVSIGAIFALILLIRRDIIRESALSIQTYAFTIVLAGAFGNLIDRLFREEGVVDFIHVHLGEVSNPAWSWFPFNVADSLICIGAGLLLLDTFRKNPKPGIETGPPTQ